jgi:DNA mismatch endonuclease (patch repair protein)
VDVHNKEARSRNMAAIGSRNTRPEIWLRKKLHARGYRYRLNDHSLPGKPDLVLRKYKAVIFVHGCFWHLHQCSLFKWPGTRAEWWRKKLEDNRLRDQQQIAALEALGWRTLIVWECAIKGRHKWVEEVLVDRISQWLQSESVSAELAGADLS